MGGDGSEGSGARRDHLLGDDRRARSERGHGGGERRGEGNGGEGAGAGRGDAHEPDGRLLEERRARAGEGGVEGDGLPGKRLHGLRRDRWAVQNGEEPGGRKRLAGEGGRRYRGPGGVHGAYPGAARRRAGL